MPNSEGNKLTEFWAYGFEFQSNVKCASNIISINMYLKFLLIYHLSKIIKRKSTENMISSSGILKDKKL